MEMADSSIMSMAMPVGGSNPDDALAVKFYSDTLKNETKSKEEGRPIFEEVDWIKINKPGSKDGVNRPIRQGDKERFPRHWLAYQAKEENQGEIGTPLAEWTGITRSQVQELKYWNISTVEQLALAADTSMSVMQGLTTLKQSAKKWLDASKGNAAAEQLAEQKAINAKLMERIEALESGEPAPKKRRKRRSKAEMEADEMAKAIQE